MPSYLPIGPSNCFYWTSKLLHGTFWPGLLLGSLSTAQPSACFATVSIGLRNCYMARFGQALKPSKAPQQLSKASAPHNPPLALPSYLPTTCHRTTLRLLCHRTSPSEVQTVSIGLRNCYMARFGQALKPSKAPQQLSKASAPHNPPLALPSYLPIGPSNCSYWASKLLHGTFWPGLKSYMRSAIPKPSKLAPLAIAQPSACFAIAPPHRRYKLFLLGFETATWHVLARPWHHLPSHNPPLALPSSEVQTVSDGEVRKLLRGF